MRGGFTEPLLNPYISPRPFPSGQTHPIWLVLREVSSSRSTCVDSWTRLLNWRPRIRPSDGEVYYPTVPLAQWQQPAAPTQPPPYWPFTRPPTPPPHTCPVSPSAARSTGTGFTVPSGIVMGDHDSPRHKHGASHTHPRHRSVRLTSRHTAYIVPLHSHHGHADPQ